MSVVVWSPFIRFATFYQYDRNSTSSSTRNLVNKDISVSKSRDRKAKMSQPPAMSSKSNVMVSNDFKAFRHPVHNHARRYALYSLAISTAASVAFYFGWTKYAGERDIAFLNNHDPYARLKEICNYPGPARYMVSCPKELLKIAEEKNVAIGKPTGPFIPVQKMEQKQEAVESAE